MSEPTGKQMKAWLKRAETIKRKAEDLAFDISTVTGVEHSMTDYIDNVVHMSEELTWMLSYKPPSLHTIQRRKNRMAWEVVKNSWQYTSIYGADGHRICQMDLEDWGVTEENQDLLEIQQEGIAKLIASAPRLLESLIAAADEMEATSATGHVLDSIKEAIREVYPEYAG